jgi:hypothetical protein
MRLDYPRRFHNEDGKAMSGKVKGVLDEIPNKATAAGSSLARPLERL